MKKNSALLILFVMITSAMQAGDKLTDNFVVVGNETYYCNDLSVGNMNTSISVEGNTLLKIPTKAVKAYVKGEKLYEYLPVINQEKDTVGWAFMQYLASNNGSRIYLYCSDCLNYDPVNRKIAPEIPVYRFYVFKGGKFVTVTDDLNEEEVLATFGVKVIV
jgi:hypothetical protein